MRLLLVTGGGGAGVTTFAAATAVLAARRGLRLHLLGADAAALAATLGPSAEWPPTLTVGAPHAASALGTNAPAVMRWLAALLAWLGLDEALAEDLNLLPAVRILTVLLSAAAEAGRFDLTVVDLGPAPEALPLLHLLALDSIADDRRTLSRVATRAVAPLLTRLADLPHPDEGVRAAGGLAAGRMQRLRALLGDGTALSVRLVLPADARAPRIELETRTVLGLHGIGLDAVVSSDRAVSPGGEGQPARLVMPWSEPAPAGPQALTALAATTYREHLPAALLAPPARPRAEVHDMGADFVVPVPPRPIAELAVSRRGARLTVRAGAWRRTFRLPGLFEPLHGRRAWHDGQVFRVRFEKGTGKSWDGAGYSQSHSALWSQ